jgi:hypothetical protein
MNRDLKSPYQKPEDANRAKQTEEPARVYVDLASGAICSDGFEELPNKGTEDPGVAIRSKSLIGASAKPTGVGNQKR